MQLGFRIVSRERSTKEETREGLCWGIDIGKEQELGGHRGTPDRELASEV